MIELVNVSKIYRANNSDFHALKNVSLSVKPQEIFGVIGKSGAGKSTLIRCVNLLERPTEGIVKVDGANLTTLSDQHLREARHKIAMIFQHFNLLAQRTVYDNIALPLELLGHSKSQIKQAVMPLLELTGLQDKQSNYPSQLSGGQKQRVAIARALASNPSVLLCDEATSALDLHTTNNILQLLKDINRTLGLTIMLITHEIDVVKQICDRVALIHHGELIEQADIFEFFTQPKTQEARDFVASSLKQELPEALQKKLDSEPLPDNNAVLRLIFHGKAASEPLVGNLMRDFGIRLNILQANIEFLKNDTLGIMVVEAIDNTANLQNGIDYLQQCHVKVEVIGYVKRNA